MGEMLHSPTIPSLGDSQCTLPYKINLRSTAKKENCLILFITVFTNIRKC
jgi:hypothetical protein